MATGRIEPQAVVIFGASGDLTRRKLIPAFYHLFCEDLLPKGFALVGYARTKMSDEQFHDYAAEAIKEFGRIEPAGDQWDAFSKRLSYIPGEFDDEGAMDHLVEHLGWADKDQGTGGGRFFYAATPPGAYPSIVERLGETGLSKEAKIVLEKPFGRDLASARELNATIHSVFDESQIFRIDHYLGKETVQNLLAFRFANGMFEPIWNRRYIDHVQITVAEDIGIEGRGAFYEQVGNMRDMVQTHLLQTLTFLAMEPPVSLEPDRLRDEKVKVLRAMELCSSEHVVLGQYEGYRDEPDVAKDSKTETFTAMELEIDSWRWAGVPFFLRTGKKLKRKATEISMAFREVPYNVFKGESVDPPRRNHLTFRVQPNEGITISVNAKKPGPGLELGRVTLDFGYEEEFHQLPVDSYEILLLEALEGDHTLFTREDEVERAWEILMPVLQDKPDPVPYEPGSWGPKEADDLIAPRHWHVWSAEGPHDRS
jgi:glucose-6-phosphate 1-dehydrogenase